MRKPLITILSIVFFLSGLAALIYQVAWQRLLTVYYGVGAISFTLIVSVYMAGLGFGALLGGSLAERVQQKIRLYFWVELFIGIFGLISIYFLTFLGRHTAGASYVLSFLYMTLFLLVPTVLMGMTLPLLTKIFNQVVKNFLETVSFLYFINTLGAAVGSVLASYLLVTFFGLDGAIYFAVFVNFLLAILIFVALRFAESPMEGGTNLNQGTKPSSEYLLGQWVYFLVFLTGFIAIAYEIVWFRVTGFLTKDSPYGFSSALSIYLLGIALGSLWINSFLRRHPRINKRSLFFKFQFLIGLYVAVIFCLYYYRTLSTPFAVLTEASFRQDLHPLVINFAGLRSLTFPTSFLFFFVVFDVFLWPLFFFFIPTFFMGASFPLVSSLAVKESHREGSTIGKVYFFNIVGNILGGIFTGFFFLPFWGTENTLCVLLSLGILFGLFGIKFKKRSPFSALKLFIVLGVLLTSILFFPKKGNLYSMMHVVPDKATAQAYLEEGVEGVVGTFKRGEIVYNYIHGTSHGGRPGDPFIFQAMEALSFSKEVKNVLIIGYGTGATCETVLKSKDVQSITLVELNRTLIKNLRKLPEIDEMLSDPRINLIFDDGRRFLLRHQDEFDVVMVDALRTTSAYSNNLYSQEFLALVKDHLSPRGIFLMWSDEHRVTLATLAYTFDYVRLYGTFCLSSNQPFIYNGARHLELIKSFPQKIEIFANLGKSKSYKFLGELHERIPRPRYLITDLKPFCEYYLGRFRFQ